MAFYTYILASRRNGTLYTGMTDDLATRVEQHRTHAFGGFTARHGVHTLVWFQAHETRDRAFERERAIKKWRRVWKLEMIEHVNPGWRDLLPGFIADQERPYSPDPAPAYLRFPSAHPRESGDLGFGPSTFADEGAAGRNT